MELKAGAVLEGRVTGITKFGAFVALPGGESGLVHISEIANAYVNDIHDYFTEGQTVTVKVLGVNEAGKINLSIKQAAPPAPPRPAPPRPAPPRPAPPPRFDPGQVGVRSSSGDPNFEDKLKHFMQESDSKMSGSKLYADRKGGGRRRK